LNLPGVGAQADGCNIDNRYLDRAQHVSEIEEAGPPACRYCTVRQFSVRGREGDTVSQYYHICHGPNGVARGQNQSRLGLLQPQLQVQPSPPTTLNRRAEDRVLARHITNHQPHERVIYYCYTVFWIGRQLGELAIVCVRAQVTECNFPAGCPWRPGAHGWLIEGSACLSLWHPMTPFYYPVSCTEHHNSYPRVL
jgi:hypothetical protein